MDIELSHLSYQSLSSFSIFGSIPKVFDENVGSALTCTYNVNVACLELLQAVFEREIHALDGVALVVGLNVALGACRAPVHGVLCRQDDGVTSILFLHPFANPLFAFFILVDVCADLRC